MYIDEADIKTRKDRVGRYFKGYLSGFVFCELSENYMKKVGIFDIMKGVPVPLGKDDVEKFLEAGVPALQLAWNIAWVIGADPHFKYIHSYVGLLSRLFKSDTASILTKVGKDAADGGDVFKACIFFRAALSVAPAYLDGMYGYAMMCRAVYLGSDDEEHIGRFKAEAMDFFELTAETHPKFADAHYYLGFAYLNMGLVLKAKLAWEDFLTLAKDSKDCEEIRGRLSQIEAPAEIEQGCNMALAGRYEQGLSVLSPFVETGYKTWWPLSYYIGLCQARLGMAEKAEASFKNVLAMNASHIESMEELADIYKVHGDLANEEKYRKKIEIIKNELT